MTVVITEPAQEDLAAIYAYYAVRNPNSAGRVVGAILGAINGLAQFPLMGRQGATPGTRERIVTRYPYRIVYRIVDDTVDVLRVVHGAPAVPVDTVHSSLVTHRRAPSRAPARRRAASRGSLSRAPRHRAQA